LSLRGFNAGRQTFVRAYGGSEVDAPLLMMAEVGFLPASEA
jgi:hypothetical protein